MGVQILQRFIEQHCPGASVPVDLLKIARSIAVRRIGGGRCNPLLPYYDHLCLVVDGECCLDRLYGGYFSDWVCGGQWNRMVQFLSVLIDTIHNNNIEVVMFFNGGLEPQRMDEWVKQQQADRKKINQVIKHVATRATPPPKVWWIPPVCLRTCLRMALRTLNVPVVCSMDDHHQEVIAFCRENNFHGLLAEDAEYIIFDPPRYFSSEQLKLTYKGSLETKEFILNEVAQNLNLQENRFCIFAALLGNYLLTEEDLTPFHHYLCPDQPKGKPIPSEVLIQALAEYVRSLNNVENLDTIGTQIFGQAGQEEIQKFKHSTQYYLNGTKDGFLQYQPTLQDHRTIRGKEPTPPTSGKAEPGCYPAKGGIPEFRDETSQKFPNYDPSGEQKNSTLTSTLSANSNDFFPKTNALGSEKTGGEFSNLSTYQGGGGGYTSPGNASAGFNGTAVVSSSNTSSGSNISSPNRTSPESSWSGSINQQKGEIKLPVTIEEDIPRDVPLGAVLFRPLRQMVYAILFNLHHQHFLAKQKKEKEGVEEKVPDVIIKEWTWNKHKQYSSPDLVPAVPLGWAVPTVQRLWCGTAPDEKKRRLRAFLTCMHSDTPLMLNTAYVQQHLLVLCCVLRYMMTDERPIFRKYELDAFLAQAVSPHLTNAEFTQNMQIPVITNRGVELATLFMQGVECALFVNDSCGAPLPWLMCCPWLFFDGKLFHQKLLKAAGAKNLVDICDGQIDQVSAVERMRAAILEGLQPQFAYPPFPPVNPSFGGYYESPLLPTPVSNRGRGRGFRYGPGGRVIDRGGQLEIAGVVVGSWGANYGQVPPRGAMSNYPYYGNSNMGGFGRGVAPRRTISTKLRKSNTGAIQH
ncbi:constitutive coactivator of PPAR-gamma-like protein 1 homolog [Limulus polyphemus]|uniref:Constitutive coactivator of PPAR-gamma-like protein 1 homolog n=1 Tax=Limulus polyphemus TaxID=6850 RepID=A0ABM1BG43_LIMPO|nr:constitutive coactivator of PPAR-gamma-like protein 1 homolog [Limulus polyphemus]